MYYIGSTKDIDARVNQHNDPLNPKYKTTARFKGPWILVYKEEFSTRSEAFKREKQLKAWKNKNRIEKLISSVGRVPTC